MQVNYHAIACGRVQGVGFRYYVLRAANALDLDGWVRNRDDGSVELVVQGEEEQVQQLLQTVEQGTLWIQVDSLQTTRQQLDESLTRQKFSVQY